MKIKKYWIVTKNTWAEVFSYRLNFVMWRIRVLLQLLTLFFLWNAIIPQTGQFLGYNQSEMLTYIIGTSLIGAMVIASRSYGVADDINQGELSNYLTKPINYFAYWFAKDLGDKAMNIVFSACEITILYLIIKPQLFIQNDLSYIFLAAIAIICALLMYFFLNFLLGMIGFWTSETWAPRFLFVIVLNFASGGLFPLDILPKTIFSVLQFLPFTYLLFFPIKVYLGKISTQEIIFGLIISTIWTIIFYFLLKFSWAKGLKVYTAQGR